MKAITVVEDFIKRRALGAPLSDAAIPLHLLVRERLLGFAARGQKLCLAFETPTGVLFYRVWMQESGRIEAAPTGSWSFWRLWRTHDAAWIDGDNLRRIVLRNYGEESRLAESSTHVALMRGRAFGSDRPYSVCVVDVPGRLKPEEAEQRCEVRALLRLCRTSKDFDGRLTAHVAFDWPWRGYESVLRPETIQALARYETIKLSRSMLGAPRGYSLHTVTLKPVKRVYGREPSAAFSMALEAWTRSHFATGRTLLAFPNPRLSDSAESLEEATYLRQENGAYVFRNYVEAGKQVVASPLGLAHALNALKSGSKIWTFCGREMSKEELQSLLDAISVATGL